MPTARLCLLADVADQIPPECWLAERMAQEPAAVAGEIVLCVTGDLVLPALHLNAPWAAETELEVCGTWSVDSENGPQRGQFLPDLQPHSTAMGQKDGEKWTAAANLQPTISKSDRLLVAALPDLHEHDAKARLPKSPALILIAGHLRIYGALTSDPAGLASEPPVHLIVLGDVHTTNAVLSGSQTHIQGELQVDDLLWSHGKSGGTATCHHVASTLRVVGDVKARVALFTGSAPPQIHGAEHVEFLTDSVRPVPHRAEFSSEIMGAVFAPMFHSGIHDGERRAQGLAPMLDRERVVAAVRAGQSATCSSADIHAAQPLAHDLCPDDAITIANILAVVRSPVIAHKEHKAADWFGQTDFALCQRHVDEDGDCRDDSVYITVWKTWDFYLEVEQEPAARSPLRKLTALLARKAQPSPPQLTLIYRRYANGQAGDWQALVPSEKQDSATDTDAGTDADADAWEACQHAWRGVLDYVRKAVGQHRARYPLYQRLQGELTAAAIEDFTSLPVFTERYNDWWDSDRNGWWEGDLWVGARQPCMHHGEPWGRTLKLSWKNGDDAPGDNPDNAHSAYQLDVDEARSGPPVVEVSYTQRQNEARTALPRGAADHIARLLRFYDAVQQRLRAEANHGPSHPPV